MPCGLLLAITLSTLLSMPHTLPVPKSGSLDRHQKSSSPQEAPALVAHLAGSVRGNPGAAGYTPMANSMRHADPETIRYFGRPQGILAPRHQGISEVEKYPTVCTIARFR